MRSFLLFLLFSSPLAAGALAVFFAAFFSVVLAGALDAVPDAGALPPVEAGLGAIASNSVEVWVERGRRATKAGERTGSRLWGHFAAYHLVLIYTDARDSL